MTTPVISCTELTRTFTSTDPPTTVLAGIDLQVQPGEFVVIMGASGSGKSTLLYALSGMDRPSSGQVSFAGQDLGSVKDRQMSQLRLTGMGFVFQQAHFLTNLTIGDNIALPALKAQPRRRGQVSARVAGLMARFEIDHVADHAVSEVSGGQLQRAAICRALATQPRVVFADEPTGALNSAMSREVMDALSAVHADGTTVVMVTHDPQCAARADRVIYLRDGQVRAERGLGQWSADQSPHREADLQAWLQEQGF